MVQPKLKAIFWVLVAHVHAGLFPVSAMFGDHKLQQIRVTARDLHGVGHGFLRSRCLRLERLDPVQRTVPTPFAGHLVLVVQIARVGVEMLAICLPGA